MNVILYVILFQYKIVYKKKCETVYKKVCEEHYKTEHEPYTETECSTHVIRSLSSTARTSPIPIPFPVA